MQDPRKQVERSIAYWELEVEQHTLLHVAKADLDCGNFPVERNLVDCLDRLRNLLDSVDARRAKMVSIYLDLNLQYGSFSLTQSK